MSRLLESMLPQGTQPRVLDEQIGLLGHGIGFDSVEALQLVAAAEREFDLTVPDDELLPEHFATVGTFVTFLERRLG